MESLTRMAAPYVLGTVAIVFAPMAPAATIASLGHAAGAQCAAADVDDAGDTVGSCAPANTNGPIVAWESSVGGSQIPLAPLATGHTCIAQGITQANKVVGFCEDTSRITFAVFWDGASPATSPVKLSALPAGLLGLLLPLPDIGTEATAFNQFGSIVGQSIAGNATSTAVIWTSGSGTPVQVSSRGDDCRAVDVRPQTSTGNPAVLLDCPNGGLTAAKIATPTGLLGAYVTASLPLAIRAIDCIATSINATGQILGTCNFNDLTKDPLSRAVLWLTPTSTPITLNLPNSPSDLIGKGSAGVAENDAGDFVFQYRTSDGRTNAGYLDIIANAAAFLPSLQAGTNVSAIGLSETGVVLGEATNATEHGQAVTWSVGSPSLSAVPLFDGSVGGTATAISPNGGFTVGTTIDSSHVEDAIEETLP